MKAATTPSLRTLLLLTTVVAAGLAVLAVYIRSAEQQQRGVEIVERLGGSVLYVDQPTDEYWMVTRLRRGLPRDYFDAVNSIILEDTKATDADLMALQSLQKVGFVNLKRTSVTDAGLSSVRGFSQLRILYLDETAVTDASLAHLSGLKHLEQVWLQGTIVSDAGLTHFKGMPQLKIIWLVRTQVTEKGLADLKNSLPGCKISISPSDAG